MNILSGPKQSKETFCLIEFAWLNTKQKVCAIKIQLKITNVLTYERGENRNMNKKCELRQAAIEVLQFRKWKTIKFTSFLSRNEYFVQIIRFGGLAAFPTISILA